ncbi:hypothetical protein ACWEQA_30660 [Nocardia sp. NPDC004085]
MDVKLPPSQSVTLNGYTNVGAFGLGAAQEEIPTATSDAGDVITLGSPFPGAGLVGQGGGIRRWIDDPSEAAGGHWEKVFGNGGAGEKRSPDPATVRRPAGYDPTPSHVGG